MCSVTSAGSWAGRPVSEYGRLCHGEGGHEGGHRCRRALMLTILSESGRLCHGDGGPRTGRPDRRRVLMLPTVQPHYLSRTGRVQARRGEISRSPL